MNDVTQIRIGNHMTGIIFFKSKTNKGVS